MNNLPNKTKRSPHELLFGYHLRNILQNKVILALEEEKIPVEDLEEMRLEALRNIENYEQEQKKRFDQNQRKPTRYKEPAASGQPRKLAPSYKGPYFV